MPFSSGTFSVFTPGTPYSAGNTISSSVANSVNNDFATGLSTCVLKDGSQTITANIPMAGFKFTGLGAGSASGNSIRYEQILGLLTTAGDTLQASAAGTFARLALGTARQVPKVNAGATALAYADQITLSTEQASTSGTSIDFASIPAGVKRITVMFLDVSTNGTSPPIVQIGTAGATEATGYVGSSSAVSAGVATASFTTGFGINLASASSTICGALTLTLEDASGFTWVCSGVTTEGITTTVMTAGRKSLAAALDFVRITTVNGSDAFDAGAINICYE